MSKQERYLFDTNAISELNKVRPNAGLMAFLRTLQSGSIYLSVFVIAEIHRGALLRTKYDPAAGQLLHVWAANIQDRFAGRILDFDLPSARRWAEIWSDRSRPVVDTMLAATAITHDLTLVTRNVRDIAGLPVRWINPWTP